MNQDFSLKNFGFMEITKKNPIIDEQSSFDTSNNAINKDNINSKVQGTTEEFFIIKRVENQSLTVNEEKDILDAKRDFASKVDPFFIIMTQENSVL